MELGQKSCFVRKLDTFFFVLAIFCFLITCSYLIVDRPLSSNGDIKALIYENKILVKENKNLIMENKNLLAQVQEIHKSNILLQDQIKIANGVWEGKLKKIERIGELVVQRNPSLEKLFKE